MGCVFAEMLVIKNKKNKYLQEKREELTFTNIFVLLFQKDLSYSRNVFESICTKHDPSEPPCYNYNNVYIISLI
jgi:hypothetical protein